MATEDLSAAGHALDIALRDRDTAAIGAARDRILTIIGGTMSEAEAARTETILNETREDIDRRIAEAGLFVFPGGEVRALSDTALAEAGTSVSAGDGPNTATTKLRAALVRMGYPRQGLAAHADRIEQVALAAMQQAGSPPEAPTAPVPPPSGDVAPDPAGEAPRPADPVGAIDAALIARLMANHPTLQSRNEMLRALRTSLTEFGYQREDIEPRMDDIKTWVRDELQRRRDEAHGIDWVAINKTLDAHPDVTDAPEMLSILQRALIAGGLSQNRFDLKREEIERWVRHRLAERAPHDPSSTEARSQPAHHEPAPAPGKQQSGPAPAAEAPQPRATQEAPRAAAQPPLSAKELSNRRAIIEATMREVMAEHPYSGYDETHGKLTQKLFFKGWDTAKIEASRDLIAEIATRAFDQRRRQRLAEDARQKARPAGPDKAHSAPAGGKEGILALAAILLLVAGGGGYWAWSAATPQTAPQPANATSTPAPAVSPASGFADRQRFARTFPVRESLFTRLGSTSTATPPGCAFRATRGAETVMGFKVAGRLTNGGTTIARLLEASARTDEKTGTAAFFLRHEGESLGGAFSVGHIYMDQLKTHLGAARADAQGRVGVLWTQIEDRNGDSVLARSGLVRDRTGELIIQDVETADLERILDSLDLVGGLIYFASLQIGTSPDLTTLKTVPNAHVTYVLNRQAATRLAGSEVTKADNAYQAGRCAISETDTLSLGLVTLGHRLTGKARALP